MNKIIIIFFCALLLSCQSTPIQNSSIQTNPTTQKEVIVPLAVGNKWIHISNTGTEVTSEVTNTVIINGKTWFQYYETGYIEGPYFVINTNEGQLESFDSIEKGSIEECTIFKFPVTQYEEYECFDVKMSVTPNIEITVPAGSFHTYLYVFGIDDPTGSQVWYAPNIGLVKQTVNGETFELIKYSIIKEE
ncbi:MAG: hypothetical protein HRU38_16915 [Saccharospirillaceae bacterium]|nr:hypothetical protein [Pseudomonadales bacterium]NRB80319.1 hypothetical protein [Saccharospirillaceae bacterium]